MSYSFKLNDLEVRVNPFPSVKITPAITWTKGAGVEWVATDRGASKDLYDLKCTAVLPRDEMVDLQTYFDSKRTSTMDMQGISGYAFPPIIDQSGSVAVSLVELGKAKQVKWAAGDVAGMYELQFTLRALTPSKLTSSPVINLRAEDGFESDHETTVSRFFPYDQSTPVYFDRNSDAGTFGPVRMVLSHEEARKTLSYVLGASTGRGKAFAFPSFPNVLYPFGAPRDAAVCKCIAVDIERVNLSRWGVNLTFVESAVEL